MSTQSSQRGFLLVEVMIGVVILLIIVVLVGVIIGRYLDNRTLLLHETKRMYLAEAGYEMIRHVRDDGWETLADLALETEHFLAVSTTSIGVTTAPEVISGVYHRSFILENLFRAEDGSVVPADTVNATADENGRVVTVTVWNETGTTTMHSVITNLFEL